MLLRSKFFTKSFKIFLIQSPSKIVLPTTPYAQSLPNIYKRQFSFNFNFNQEEDENQAEKDQERQELLVYLESKLESSPSLESFNQSLQILTTLYTKQYISRDQVRERYRKCMEYFESIPKEEPIFEQESLTAASEHLTNLSQAMVEALEADIVVDSLKTWAKFDPKFSKPYWHFVEFLLTRTKFINLFEGRHVVTLLNSYYQIKERYEIDKFAYIFDKCDEYICGRGDEIKFNHSELARVLFLYGKCNLGSDELFSRLLGKFKEEEERINVKDLVACGWSFVSYNVTKKDKQFRIYHPNIYQKVVDNIKELNSYQIKQFLWAYHKETEIFGNK